ncbi:MAG: DUF4296 domain-containing protein [Cruoricaptor ignavus]|nr:DUF4296 domain-containing protein [Cruoricaptor ignavus]
MKYGLTILLLILMLISCKDAGAVNVPKDLISEEKMSEIIADFAINDQMGYLNAKADMAIGSRYILEKHKISAKAFSDSYKYYLASPRDLAKIMENAQEIVLKQDPEAKKYIDSQKNHKGEEILIGN